MRVEAMDVAVDSDFLWALDREMLTRVPRPPDDEITGFPTGSASASFEWIINGGQNCPGQAEMALLLLGPSARNVTVSCGAYSYTFSDLAAGQYVMHVESPATSIGFASDPFTLTDSSHEVIGPLDMGSL